LNKSIQK